MQTLLKYSTEPLSRILSELEMPTHISETLRSKEKPIEVLNYFTEEGEFDLAVRFLALGLPKRERVWWGYVCAETIEPKKEDQKVQSLYQLLKEWIRTLGEEERWAIRSLCDALGMYTPISWVGMSAFWSGGNIAQESPHPVEASPFMSGHAIANAVMMSSEKTPQATEALKRFLRKGMHIAMGGNGRIE